MRWYTSFCLTRFCNDRPPCKIRHRYTLCILQGGCGYQHTPAYKTRHKYTLRILTGGGYPYIPEMTPPLAPPPPHPSVRWVCPQRHAALSAHAAGGPSCERRHTYTVGVFTGRGVCIPAPSPPATAEPAEWGFLCPPAHDTHTPLPVRSALHIRCVSHREGCRYAHAPPCKIRPTYAVPYPTGRDAPYINHKQCRAPQEGRGACT